MSLQPEPIAPVPETTARVAHAAFPNGNLYILIRDELGAFFNDQQFRHLFPSRGQPAEAPWRLALITILQFIEGLSDRRAAEAVRARIDWKYVLSLELTDPGFDFSVLCEFRKRLLEGGAEALLFDTMLEQFKAQGWLKARGRQRTDSTHVLAAVRAMNRLECVVATMRHALNSLAVAAPDWLRAISSPEWVDRYGSRADDYHLPKSKEKRSEHAQQVGEDGHLLLSAVYAADAPTWLHALPAVETLRCVWVQQFYVSDGAIAWRTEQTGIPPARLFISSPHDTDAHLARKRTTQWVGYKVHLTETCDEDQPRLITHVETTAAPVADGETTPEIHRTLKDKDLLPGIHIVDTGYLDADLLVSSRKAYNVDLLGPTRADYKWQARTGGAFAASQFRLDWEQQRATCPAGRTSVEWTPAVDREHNQVIKIKFSTSDCKECDSRPQCTRSKHPRRTLTVRQQEQHLALQAGRQRETTEEYAAEYKKRAGIEGTISQGVRSFKLRRARYIGQAKTHLQHILTAAAINFVRVGNWLSDVPLAQTRHSSYARLMRSPIAV